MATLVELIIDVLLSVLWVPERRWLRVLVLAVYAAIFTAVLVAMIAALT